MIFPIFLLSALAAFSAAQLTDKENKKIVAEHNRLRSTLKDAINMKTMTYDPALAQTCQRNVEKCHKQHIGGDYGSNIAYSSIMQGSSPEKVKQNRDDLIKSSTKMWWNEKKNYPKTNEFVMTPQAVTLHYTQMAWAESNKLGCGMKRCSGEYILECCYTPRGNMRQMNLQGGFDTVYLYKTAAQGSPNGRKRNGVRRWKKKIRKENPYPPSSNDRYDNPRKSSNGGPQSTNWMLNQGYYKTKNLWPNGKENRRTSTTWNGNRREEMPNRNPFSPNGYVYSWNRGMSKEYQNRNDLDYYRYSNGLSNNNYYVDYNPRS